MHIIVVILPLFTLQQHISWKGYIWNSWWIDTVVSILHQIPIWVILIQVECTILLYKDGNWWENKELQPFQLGGKIFWWKKNSVVTWDIRINIFAQIL